MSVDGQVLERLVAGIEKLCLPPGFDVAFREREHVDGVQVAEFDLVVRGKVGTGDFSWLIECRDRPSQGAAGTSWIEQLVGRRMTFGFNKVTAVSTTGFSPGAQKVANCHGIELRKVVEIDTESFLWIKQLRGIQAWSFPWRLETVTMKYFDPSIGGQVKQKFDGKLTAETRCLRESGAEHHISLSDFNGRMIHANGERLAELPEDGKEHFFATQKAFRPDEMWLSLDGFEAAISAIVVQGQIQKVATLLEPRTVEYRGEDGLLAQAAVQTIKFGPDEIQMVSQGLPGQPGLAVEFGLAKSQDEKTREKK